MTVKEALPSCLRNILECRYRASPRYDLVMFDRLTSEEQEALDELCKEPDFYGVLRPREPGLTIKAVGVDIALLFLSLKEPCQLPHYLFRRDSISLNEMIARLVLDGILEIETMKGFLSGPAAHTIICIDNAASAGQENKLFHLSVDALRYAQQLKLSDAVELSRQLYFYNRMAASPRWRQELPTVDKVAEYLGIKPGGPCHAILEKHWELVPCRSEYGSWLIWQTHNLPLQTHNGIYKLYVSPHPLHMREAFEETVKILADLGVHAFKVGRDIFGLLRPDKMMIYFTTLSDLKAAAEHLSYRLRRIPAHGVPFTSPLDAKGLLSWGMDPPEQVALFSGQRLSWRRWLIDRLASALILASQSGSTLEPWQFAKERIRLEGVDPASWTPPVTLWNGSHK
jgi:hypothetical protein